ncbi:MAG: phosphatidylglycerol lysyltransferase domain-containing protein, partial [Deltaproteobacteria bacterium]|nr:phosphatidylglycerol lysyltransferase domain-containing protein [Deltaproteobacteria bacterium]
VDGRIEAFSLGESLSPDTALIHVEKGSPGIRGIYVALCSNFCRAAFSDKIYINREQDLGLPGLRWSKESLKPDHMRKKFNIWPD